MAQYATLKAAIDAVIKANGQREITGTVLNQTLNAMVNSLGANYQFAGVATPSTNPGTPDQNVFYLAGQVGTYTNFNNIAIPNGISFLIWNGSWSSQTVLSGDGGVFDISAYKATGGTLATFADLSAALGENGENVPVKFGGMQVRFVSSSDNNYVQYRLMSQIFTTDISKWQSQNIGTQELDSLNDNYINDFIRDYGHYWSSGGTKATNSKWACVAIDVTQYAGKTLRVRAGDSKPNHHSYLCFVKLSDNTYNALSTYLVERFSQYSTYKLPSDAVELELSYSLSTDAKPLVPSLMVACEELDGKVKNLVDLTSNLPKTINDYLTIRGIDFSAEGSNPNMSKFIRSLSFDIPASAKGHELKLALLGINPSDNRFYFGIYDITEDKLVGNARTDVYTDVPTSGVEVFNFKVLSSSAAASYMIYEVNLIVDWSYYPGWYRYTATGAAIYKVLTVNDVSKVLLFDKVNSLLPYCDFNLTPDGNGYYGADGTIRTNTLVWSYKSISIVGFAGNILRVRAGGMDDISDCMNHCYFRLSDESIVNIKTNYVIERNNNYSFVRVPNDAVYMLLSWGSTIGEKTTYPMLKYEPSDDAIYSVYASKGYICSDNRYSACILGIEIDIPVTKRNNLIVLRHFGVHLDNHRFYIEAFDLTENKRLGYANYGNYNPIPDEGFEVFDFTSFTGGEASYTLGRLRIAIDWSKYSSDMYYRNTNNLIHLNYVSANSFFYLYDQTQKLENVDINDNLPVFPSQLFLLSDKEMPLYKNSLMTKYSAGIADVDINIKSDDTAQNGRKIFEIKEPTYFSASDFGNNATIFMQRSKELNKLIYKDVKVFHKDISTLSGKTIKVLSLGDSLTQGRGDGKTLWRTTPVCMLAQGLLQYGVTTQFIGTMVRSCEDEDDNTVTLKYEGRGGWRYRTFVGLESKYAGINQYVANPTKHEWVEGTDGDINQIKQQNPFLYEATAQDLANNPEWCFHFVEGNTEYNKSYAEDDSLGDYVIFDPVRYFSQRNIDIPDVVTIALGTNEWYLNSYGGFDNSKATACAEFIIKQFRKVSANLNIVVIPLNNFPTSRETDWENYCMPLCSNVIRVCDELIAAGDNHLFICPIYAQGSRKLGFNGTTGSASNLSNINDTKQIEIDTNVHMLYEQDDSNYDYRDSLVACIANLID